MRTPEEAAEFMIERYGTKDAALRMCTEHRNSYDDKTHPGYLYWKEVDECLRHSSSPQQ